jgi:hypothetical protein
MQRNKHLIHMIEHDSLTYIRITYSTHKVKGKSIHVTGRGGP